MDLQHSAMAEKLASSDAEYNLGSEVSVETNMTFQSQASLPAHLKPMKSKKQVASRLKPSAAPFRPSTQPPATYVYPETIPSPFLHYPSQQLHHPDMQAPQLHMNQRQDNYQGMVSNNRMHNQSMGYMSLANPTRPALPPTRPALPGPYDHMGNVPDQNILGKMHRDRSQTMKANDGHNQASSVQQSQKPIYAMKNPYGGLDGDHQFTPGSSQQPDLRNVIPGRPVENRRFLPPSSEGSQHSQDARQEQVPHYFSHPRPEFFQPRGSDGAKQFIRRDEMAAPLPNQSQGYSSSVPQHYIHQSQLPTAQYNNRQDYAPVGRQPYGPQNQLPFPAFNQYQGQNQAYPGPQQVGGMNQIGDQRVQYQHQNHTYPGPQQFGDANQMIGGQFQNPNQNQAYPGIQQFGGMNQMPRHHFDQHGHQMHPSQHEQQANPMPFNQGPYGNQMTSQQYEHGHPQPLQQRPQFAGHSQMGDDRYYNLHGNKKVHPNVTGFSFPNSNDGAVVKEPRRSRRSTLTSMQLAEAAECGSEYLTPVRRGHTRQPTSARVPMYFLPATPRHQATNSGVTEPFPDYYDVPAPRSDPKQKRVSFETRVRPKVIHASSKSLQEGSRMSAPGTQLPKSSSLQSLAESEESTDYILVPVSNDPYAKLTPLPKTALVPVDNLDGKSMQFKNFVSSFMKTGNPSYESAQKYLPLCTQLEMDVPRDHGVLKITNVPYMVKRSEIFAFLGKQARIVEESEGEAVHVIMDGLTGKTLDAYVEFKSLGDAVNAVGKYKMNRMGGHGGRLGDRHVAIEVVGPEQLMQELFPKTKHVIWQGYEPIITQADPNDELDTPFQSFITAEELTMLLKHIEQPSRSPFSNECPQRPYECLISTMIKYPWHKTKHIMVKDRDHLFKIMITATSILKDTIAADREMDNTCLTPQLLKRMCAVVKKCKGFTLAQKHEIFKVAGIETDWPPYPEDWIWQALGPAKTVVDEEDVLEYYMHLLNKLSTHGLSYQELRRLSEEYQKNIGERKLNDSIWGPLRIDYPVPYETSTMDKIAGAEYEAIDKYLSKLKELETPKPALTPKSALRQNTSRPKSKHVKGSASSSVDTRA